MKNDNNNNKVLFNDCGEEWLLKLEAEGCLKQSTCVKYQYIYNTHIKPVFADIYISDLCVGNLNCKC